MTEEVRDQSASMPEPTIRTDIDLAHIREELRDATPEEQMKYILENICMGPGKCQFIESQPFTQQIDVQNLGLKPEDTRYVQDTLDVLKELVNAPIIVDGFGSNHGGRDENGHLTGRRGWRTQMNQQFGPVFHQVYEQNKLKWNKISQNQEALGILEWILGEYPALAPLQDSIHQAQQVITFSDPNEYDKLTTEEKVNLVEQYDQAIRQLLEEFSRATQPVGPS